jgi:alpha-methylacyl-CoA racemase
MGDSPSLPDQYDRAGWPLLRERFAAAFLTRSRDEWMRVFESSEACVSPVLTLSEAHADAHAIARDAFVDVAGVAQPAPAPRFSRTPGSVRGAPPERGSGGESALRDWGFPAKEIAGLRAMGVGFDAAVEPPDT